jgi:mRNA interferase YafQ
VKIVYTTQFKRDYKRAKKQHRALAELQKVITELARGRRLEARHRDHPLVGQWKDFRDCHIEPDWVLIYQAGEDTMLLARLGTHADLFEKPRKGGR